MYLKAVSSVVTNPADAAVDVECSGIKGANVLLDDDRRRGRNVFGSVSS